MENIGIDFGVAFDKLAGFQTADEIADFFRSEEIKAYQKNASHCAISMWMRKVTGKDTISTGAYGVFLDHEDGRSEMLEQNTAAMTQFVVSFDCGNYPDLVAEDNSKYVRSGFTM